jgi:glycerate-2-kinase
MAEALEAILENRIWKGLINVPHADKLSRLARIQLRKAGHPIPDEDGVEGSKQIVELLTHLTERDLVICLISGGGSALLPLPSKGISLKDKQRTTEALLKAGATINEVNTVRKHISQLKGGRLAEKAKPATLVSLILSDVLGDPLDSIASGPTAPDTTTFQDAVEILRRYGLWTKVPPSVRRTLRLGLKGKLSETPKLDDPVFNNVHNIIIGNNREACYAAKRNLQSRGLETLLLTSQLQGEARHAGMVLASILREMKLSGNPLAPPAAIVAGGETTVTVTGSGKGGRNQEMMLSASFGLKGFEGVAMASMGTDGMDGPTDAAGAIVDGNTLIRSGSLGLDAFQYLRNNDSYGFFSKLKDLIFTGLTGTNVNDITILVALRNLN